ncbi:hypothetical protein [Bartonella jaculi]|uniref:Uncharacterized protein n=1 Tax=Bartonella jaculi TaxID=686226 RepID=A0ABP9NFW2_9HYPH
MSDEAKEMKEMLSIYKPSSDMMQLFNIIPSLFLVFLLVMRMIFKK